MFQAKDFYLMTGLTRASARYYTDLGLLSPKTRENGYREYQEKDLVNAMLIRNLRALDYTGSDIERLFHGEIEMQSASLKKTQEDLEDKIRSCEDRIRVLKIYIGILDQYRDTSSFHLMDPLPMKAFFLDEAIAKNRKAAEEEIAHCINAQPFVHVTAKGSFADFQSGKDITLHPGYEYRTDRDSFRPLHEEFYQEVSPKRVLLQRIMVPDPLHLKADEVQGLRSELIRRNLSPAGQFLAGISCLVKKDAKQQYCVSIRVPLL